MTNTNDTTIEQAPVAAPTGSKAPTHAVYHVRERKGDKGFWTRIGSAWPHADGNGFNLQVDVFPLDGRITLRIITDKKD